MSSRRDQVREMAERIARRVAEGEGSQAERKERTQDVGGEIEAVRATLDELQKRLAHIESQLPEEERKETVRATRSEARAAQSRTSNETEGTRMQSLWLSGMYVPVAPAHPSQERFGINEAAIAELVDFFESEKKCSMEPGGKPCDHCAMCSSRGF